MSEQRWEEQLRRFLKKTGEDLRRASEDIRGEAQKLLTTVMEPDRQERVRGSLRELGVWAKKTAEDVARRVEGAAVQAETAVNKAAASVRNRNGHEEAETHTRRPAAKAAAPKGTKKPAAKRNGGGARKPTSTARTKKKPAAKKPSAD